MSVRKPHLYFDMDGVLADFDRHYEAVLGYRPDKLLDNADWNAVRQVRDFYLDIPPMPDLEELWTGTGGFAATYDRAVLTGVPSSVPEAADNKRAWVRRHLGEVETICCRSRDKRLHCMPGDVLIDDWDKYRHLWEQAGGIFIVHTSARVTLERLEAMHPGAER